MKSIIALATLLFSLHSLGYQSWEKLRSNLIAAGGNPKMIDHVQCFFKQHSKKTFELRHPGKQAFSRCYPNGGVAELNLKRTFALIDYTVSSNRRRMFLVDRVTGGISTMAVAHGRYKSWYMRRRSKKNHNTTKWAKYFSNQPGSNAPSSGFYLAGHEYYGKWDRSLVLHGLEMGINDNACRRAVVLHSHRLVSKNKAYVMSSGCPMVSKSYLDHVVDILKAPEDQSIGGLVFIYGPREKRWKSSYCSQF